jgi:hypothetical protein
MQEGSGSVSPAGLCHCVKGSLSPRKAAVAYRLLLAAGVVALTCGGGPLDELPIPTPPPDPLSLLNALRPRLPPNWRMGQPSDYLGIAQVKVNILDEWRGNPVAAAVSMCPDPEDEIWQQVRVFRLIMRYHQRDWPPYECRP